MGYNTTVFILNDNLADIRKNSEQFTEDIAHGLNDGTDYALGQTTVMRSGHADEFRLYATHYNSIIELSPYSRRTLDIIDRSSTGTVQNIIDQAYGYLDQLQFILDTNPKT